MLAKLKNFKNILLPFLTSTEDASSDPNFT